MFLLLQLGNTWAPYRINPGLHQVKVTKRLDDRLILIPPDLVVTSITIPPAYNRFISFNPFDFNA